MILEAIATSPDDVAAVEAGGADRIELCAAIALGGLTPSIGFMKAARARTRLPIMAMVRPRTGGFAYDEGELAAMEFDVEALLDAGADGVVLGVLDDGGRVDVAACARLLSRTRGAEAVFHRAFDVTPDPFATLETLIDLGFRRVLSSGGKSNALEGADLLRTLVERADGRIEILPGGGVRAHNAREILARTGANQIHMTFFAERSDPSMRHTQVGFNGRPAPEAAYSTVDANAVAEVRRIVGDA